MKGITEIDLESGKVQSCEKRLADCVVRTHDNKILLQYRPLNWSSNAGGLNLFGGHVEDGESVIDGLCREIHEELGAPIAASDVQFIGAVSEDWTDHKEFVHVYFWHDKDNQITGCYEAEARKFDNIEEALAQPKLMDYAKWALGKCEKIGLFE